MARQKLTKRQRFTILKRDNFSCQYCGRKAPDVILEIDHIIPVSKGGTNDFNNLITSCRDCNRGKGAEYEETEEFECSLDYYESQIMSQTNYFLTDKQRDQLKRLALNYGFEELNISINIALNRYFDGDLHSLSVAIDKIGGILYNRRKEKNGNI